MTTYPISLPVLKNGTHLTVEADFFPSTAPSRGITILYFHGGGLLCGSRKDLPDLYRTLFLDHGYDFLAFDYPLAPESSVSQIVESCRFLVSWFLDYGHKELGLDSSRYILFGRSSGAYLALQTAIKLPPLAMILFYGYQSLMEKEFSSPNSYYRSSYPSVSWELAFQAIKNSPDLDALRSPRILMYLYARQSGTWSQLLGEEKERFCCSLSDEQLSALPPAFLTASSMDHDVPFRISKAMAKKIPGSLFYPVYNLEHEFDQDLYAPEGWQAYKACLEWLKQQV